MALVRPPFFLTRVSSPPPHWSPCIYSAPPQSPPIPSTTRLFPIVFRGVFSKRRSDPSFCDENPSEASHVLGTQTHVSSMEDKILQGLAHQEPRHAHLTTAPALCNASNITVPSYRRLYTCAPLPRMLFSSPSPSGPFITLWISP